jgi:cell division protein FtsW (lipid II flippase)
MTAPILTTILFIPLTLLILSGRGDNLIAGYNTASKEEREQYHIKRLRWVIAGIMLATIIVFWIPILTNDKDPYKLIVPIGMFPICIIGIILANTWAKKK